ncbi:gluconate 2-dehydrogenase subunit 3 family protein [Rhodohalobacter sp. 8-1]|uniref:gluconate 2-dehydrogenase subunit 3 family protein n=1 Tax=Rhodohalobacter sp. 8-1 TaxID=3131972 RepID=UPI0030EE0A5F
MDRKEYIKLMMAGSLGAGLFMATGCTEEDRQLSEQIIANNSPGDGYGRTEEEKKHDQRLHADTFFTTEEKEMVAVLSDIIIPADEISGSATDAGVVEFIEFMMKDYPPFQVPTRGGLMWLNNLCRKDYGSDFLSCSSQQRMEVIDKIAWPNDAAPDMEYGVRFFNRMRNLVSTGFFTSEMGIKDMDYRGNRANFWDGVPDDVLAKHGLSYDKKTLEETIRFEERGVMAEWDEDGNLIRPRA